MSKIVLVTGGARSGKSTYAENYVAQMGSAICYIATAIPFDDGMKERIKLHRAQRPRDWETVEKYEGLSELFMQQQGKYHAYLLDCLTLMVTNLMFKDMPDFDTLVTERLATMESMIYKEVDEMVEAIRESGSSVVMVTNEVGMGIVPENAIARLYRDIAGRVNQRIGHAADEVYLVVCGQALKIKGK
jgi:adenosylcobinamide kinase/adenosylcobinamide-phosphate guanylyltransferase